MIEKEEAAKRRFPLNRVRFALLCCLVLCSLAGPGRALAATPDETSEPPRRHVFLWAISPALRSGTLFLLGSTHGGVQPVERMDPAIEDAFARADTLAVEVDTQQTSANEIARYASELGTLRDGTSLRARVSPDVYTAARAELEQRGLPPDALDAYKPWLAAMMLSGHALAQLGYDAKFGAESYFLERARGKRVVELEGARSQLRTFDELSPGVQSAMFEQTVSGLQLLPKTISALFASWAAGDAARMRSLVFEDTSRGGEVHAFYERVYFARNRQMMSKLAGSLEQGGVWFAVIGAGHMVGEQGIPALFAERGYRVRQLLAQGCPVAPVVVVSRDVSALGLPMATEPCGLPTASN